MKKKGRAKLIILIIFLLIFLVGLGLFLYPYINGFILNRKQKDDAQSFLLLQDYVPDETTSENEMPYADLRRDVEIYNAKIIVDHQSELKDSAAYEEPSFILADYGLPSEVFGILTIPKLDLEMPIYLGANMTNLSNGTAHMSQTSLPIGGDSTNCVIAGHRGWKGAHYFLYLPKLQEGDEVYITNLWDKLKYRVIDKKIIYSTESEYIYIQEGKDLVTLLTCDYGANGSKHRYIVICERVEDE